MAYIPATTQSDFAGGDYPNLAPSELAYRKTSYAGTDAVAGDNAKLWLPIWSGEVLHAYDEYRMFEPLVTNKSIASGRSMEFPITGTVDLKPAWGAGEYLHGDENSKAGNFAVTLDNRPMAAHFELDNVDLMITQWEYRQELARQAGQTLANARDKQLGTFIAGAGLVNKINSDPRTGLLLPGVSALSADTPTPTTALELLEAIEDFTVSCQENDVPVGRVVCAVTPRMFQQIRRLGVAETGNDPSGSVTNMQPMFGGVAAAGGLGAGFQQGMNALTDSLTYMGVSIIKCNHLPTSDIADPGVAPENDEVAAIGEGRYSVKGAAANIKALIWMPECVASLRKTGLTVDTEDDARRNTTFTVASMMNGTGILKPELAKVVIGSSLDISAASNAAAERALVGLAFTGQTGGSADSTYVNKWFGYEDA